MDQYSVLKYFTWKHLTNLELQRISESFAKLTESIATEFPDGDPEIAVGLRKLLEAKDCIIRGKVTQIQNYPKTQSSEP